MTTVHEPVLLDEVIRALLPPERENFRGLFLDCTVGGAGHARALLASSKQLYLWAMDQDEAAVTRAIDLLRPFGDRAIVVQGNFGELDDAIGKLREMAKQLLPPDLAAESGQPRFDGVLADLGYSSDQLEDPTRGLSFQAEGPLDMRLDRSRTLTAETILNEYEPRELRQVFQRGGLRSGADALARKVITARPLRTTKQFAALCEEVLHRPRRTAGSHPATVPFQALRIAVNAEFEVLRSFLGRVLEYMRPGARLAVISFHSLEDEIVAGTMRGWEQEGRLPGLPVAGDDAGIGRLLTRKATVADEDEVRRNPRSRSARLRVFEKGGV